MVMKILISMILLISCSFFDCQILMTVKKLPSNKYQHYIPENDEAQNYEYRYPGHILEITISNTSDKIISFPLDTMSYSLPFTADIKQFYNKRLNIITDGDLHNALGIYPFVYQNGVFKNYDVGTDPFYEEKQLAEIQKIKKI